MSRDTLTQTGPRVFPQLAGQINPPPSAHETANASMMTDTLAMRKRQALARAGSQATIAGSDASTTYSTTKLGSGS